MERLTINKNQIVNKGQSETGKAIIKFMTDNFTEEILITVFTQENPTNIRVPGQLNTYAGHKILGTYDFDNKIFEAFGLESEDISEIMTHKNQQQWLNPYKQEV